jgi:hypothetical protein
MAVLWTLWLGALVGVAPGATAPPVTAVALAIGSATPAIATRMASRPVAVLDLIDIFFDAYGVS